MNTANVVGLNDTPRQAIFTTVYLMCLYFDFIYKLIVNDFFFFPYLLFGIFWQCFMWRKFIHWITCRFLTGRSYLHIHICLVMCVLHRWYLYNLKWSSDLHRKVSVFTFLRRRVEVFFFLCFPSPFLRKPLLSRCLSVSF